MWRVRHFRWSHEGARENALRRGCQDHTHSRSCCGTLTGTAWRSRPRLGSRFARLGLEVGRGFLPRATLLDELLPLGGDDFGGSGLGAGHAIRGPRGTRIQVVDLQMPAGEGCA
jgi:hypothetical protein